MEQGLRAVRSWYGLKGEIDVEHDRYHLVRVGSISLAHPPLVNLLLRRGLPSQDRYRLSFLHEFGHLQTLPIAMIHLLSLIGLRRKWSRANTPLKSLTRILLAHQAVWELASEVYVLFKSRVAYIDTYKKYPNKLGHFLFWGGMTSVATLFTVFLFRENSSQGKEIMDL